MMTAPLSVLLIEDNSSISANIADYFSQHGAVLDFAVQGQQGLQLALQHYYDVVVLDLMLPVMDGLTLCKALRSQANRHIPVLMLTARDTLDDKLHGFACGADDYLSKPFALPELWARCQALTRRPLPPAYQVRVGELLLNKQSRQISRQGQLLQLKPIAWQILCLLIEAYPRPMSRTELCRRIWGDEPTESDALRSHLYQLRKVLDQPFPKPMLKTLHGVGFALELSSDD
ncbi:response regulator transcription factor [Alkalimonas amylolytica]|uniref:DNA-binding response regulator, OmpR family, contains REC and winged-helix (WHTH) domain n=1 Tax=Alkalimonas amylolytica TaxID=152573 RepID=A0A1H4BU15_ALKAM|nr:response regulator transcription factor [Alkalimonas amylolytica]SEA51322.1 DNA-binding response regulator, OmpR family, contains REC and winged-helix (wHTH) domain [Alkalimonas amylolytica]